jgi:hypothetical protein
MTLTSSGILGGAPYHAGVYTFTLQVMGSDLLTSTLPCTLTVAAPASVSPASLSRGSVSFGTAGEDGTVSVGFALEEALSVRATGRAYLTGGDFTSGGREADFVIEAGETQARFTVDGLAIANGNSADVSVSIVLQSEGMQIPVETAGTETLRSRRSR